MSFIYEIVSGNIAEGISYQVTGVGTSIVYNSSTYVIGDVFIGVSGQTTYTKTDGTEVVTNASQILGETIGFENDYYTGLYSDDSTFLGISISTEMAAVAQIIRAISPKKKSSVLDYIFTINTTLGTGTPDFTLPTVSGQTYDAVIDWGDFNITNVTAYNSAGISHTYVTGGTYQIKISGKFGGWSFNNTGDKDKITEINQFGDVGFDYLRFGWYGCANLATIPNDGIKSQTVDRVYYLFRDTIITLAPSNLLTLCPNIIDITAIFRNVKNLVVEEGIFESLLELKYANEAFSIADSVILPNNLFFYNKKVVEYYRTLHYIRGSGVAIPDNMFDLSVISIVVNFSNLMLYSYSSGTIQDIWNYALSATHVDALKGQTNLTNYDDVPDDWKGL